MCNKPIIFVIYYMLKRITDGPEGGRHIAPCPFPPPKYAMHWTWTKHKNVLLVRLIFLFYNENQGRQSWRLGTWGGRRPREGTGGTVPQKFEVGDGPCIGSPNILRSSVVGCA